jgi:TPR repeat protein
MLDRAVTAYAAACGIVHHFRKPGQDSSAKAEPIPVCAHAADLAEIGSGHGLARASHNRGAIDHDAERYVDALKWFTRAYEQGFALSALAIGTMYALGQGVPKDDGEALIWFTRAAERKDALALPEQGTR